MTVIDRAQLTAAAGVDPWALLAQVTAGDPGEIERLAAAFYRAAGDTLNARTSTARAHTYAAAGYRVDGAAPIDDNAAVRSAQATLSDAADKLPKIAKLLAGVGEDLACTTRTVHTEVVGLDSTLAGIDRQWSAFMQSTGHGLPPDDRQSAQDGFVAQAVAAVRSFGAPANTAVMDYEHTLARATKSMADLGYVAPQLREAGETPTVPLPVGSNPTTVAGWWAGLSPSQREYLIDHEYSVLGQLKGLPAPVLDTANRHRITDDEATLNARIRALAGYVQTHPDDDGAASRLTDARTRLRDDEGIVTELDKPGPGMPPAQTYVLAFDPNGAHGQNGVEISYGDPDSADNTAVVVPGTTNRASKLSSVGADGRSLYATMTGSSKAVVVWLDGPEPQSILPDAGTDGYANDSAPNLVADITGLRAAHVASVGDQGHLTAIGHSYGSYILGKAMTQGAPADDVVLVGSPGVGVNRARDLGIDPSHVWDGEAGDDPILYTEKRFTPDPLSGTNPEDSDFGARHFSVSGSHGHSEYYKAGSESLRNMGAIASGNYGGVDTVGAPDYRGYRELPGDLLSNGIDPVDTQLHAGHDVLTGHPIKALGDEWDGAVKTGKDAVHTVEDAGSAVKSGAGWVWDHL